MNRLNIFIFLFVIMSSVSYCQNKEVLKSINKEIWEPFTKSFETFDIELFESLHSNDLIRVSADGRNIKKKDTYIDGYNRRWTKTSIEQTISFRFLERLNSTDIASERGIYKLTMNPNTEQEKTFYGKFHVIMKKEHETWRILVDYDSSESNTINSDSYYKAFAQDDFEKY